MNWSSLVTSVVALILILPLVDFTEPPLHFVCFIPILVYAIYVAVAVIGIFYTNTATPASLHQPDLGIVGAKHHN